MSHQEKPSLKLKHATNIRGRKETIIIYTWLDAEEQVFLENSEVHQLNKFPLLKTGVPVFEQVY